MWKPVLSAVAAATIAGTGLGQAQTRAPEPDQFARRGPSVEDMNAFTEARIAALRAGLMLTQEQESHWGGFEQTVRAVARERIGEVTAPRDATTAASPIERLRRRAEQMSRRANNLKRIADAAEPLYQSLSAAQKRRFVMLARFLGTRRAGQGPRRGWRDRGLGGDGEGSR